MICGRQTMTRDTRGWRITTKVCCLTLGVLLLLYIILFSQFIRLSGAVVCGRFVGRVSIRFTDDVQNQCLDHQVQDHKFGHLFCIIFYALHLTLESSSNSLSGAELK